MNTEVLTLDCVGQKEFFNFLKTSSLEIDHPASTNMWSEDWETDNTTLPYLIYKKKRFSDPKGEFYILKINGKIEAVSGVYISDFDNNVALGGVRAWVNKEYRGKYITGKYLLSKHYQWAKDNGAKLFFVSFNEYNKNMIKFVKRSGFGRTKNRTPDMAFYRGVYEAPFPLNIQYTKQWVVYDKIDPNYEFDFEKIKWVDTP